MAASSEANTPEFTDLLSQFKCLGTTDRDTLISELFSLLNGQISREKCAFVLEMSSWNLQNAIGAYYDYLGSSTTTAPSISYGMRLEGRGVSEPYGPIPTGTRFSYTWIVVNTGCESWPSEARLVYYSGYYFNGILEGPIGQVVEGERKMITVNIFCPPVPGHYHTEMRLKCNQGFFAGKLLIDIDAVESSEMAGLTEQLSAMSTMPVQPNEPEYCGLEEAISPTPKPSSTFHNTGTTDSSSASLYDEMGQQHQHYDS